MQTRAPSATSRWAMPSPMPRLAPVTIATLPCESLHASSVVGWPGRCRVTKRLLTMASSDRDVNRRVPIAAARREPDARTRLLAAAVEAFAAKGFHGTTTRDISTAAGMSPAALYVHHRSKEELLHQISLAGHERILALVSEAVGRRRPTRSSSSAA